MTSENPSKANENNANDKQNQLKFEFSNIEPITPKKPIVEKPSLFDKAKDFLPKRETKEQSVNQNTTEQASVAQATAAQAATESAVEQPEVESSPANETTAREPLGNRLKKLENLELLNRLPTKHRRLFIALLGFVLLILIFIWLKPSSTDTVDALQAQNANSLPIEFQPLNQSEEEQINQAIESANDNNPLLPNLQPTEPAQANVIESAVSPTETRVPETAAPIVPASSAVKESPKPQEVKPQVTKPQVTPQVKPQPAKTESVKPQAAKPQTTKAQPQTSKPAPVETAVAANSRTLTIPQGTSLMQVFRNNNLNIADVNAMTKANGGEKALSSFKAGDKVTVQLNAQGRVSRLTLQNGSSFSRNSDGSYTLKK